MIVLDECENQAAAPCPAARLRIRPKSPPVDCAAAQQQCDVGQHQGTIAEAMIKGSVNDEMKQRVGWAKARHAPAFTLH